MRRLIALRTQHTVFGRGEIEFLYPENAKVLAFVRRDGEHTVLVVANLSRFATAVSSTSHEFRGQVPVELFGATEFASIHEGPYQLTLGPYGFYWFSLESAAVRARLGAAGRRGPPRPQRRRATGAP